MSQPRSHERLLAVEQSWCLRANTLCSRRYMLRYFTTVSRLGDGVFLYGLMAMLVVVNGATGLRAALHLAAIGVVALLLYRSLKRHTRRSRPFASDLRIRAWIAPLDEYSFPSGHTLHAVAFSVVAVAYYPKLGWLLIPFTASVAVSRVVLGLHYPSDVLAATGIGTLLAVASLCLIQLLGMPL